MALSYRLVLRTATQVLQTSIAASKQGSHHVSQERGRNVWTEMVQVKGYRLQADRPYHSYLCNCHARSCKGYLELKYGVEVGSYLPWYDIHVTELHAI